MLPIVISHQRRGIVVLVSRHRDGEWIARIAGRFGFGAARGSSTRGGEEGMRELMAALAAGRCAGVTVDGPRGPARHVKPGAVWLASRTGCPLVPVTSASSRTHVFRSWDRFRLPQPFARVGVTSGEPLQVPRDLDDQGLEDWRRKLERALDDLTLATATRVGGREVVESAPASSSMSPR
jgi:hypothetical protein